MQYQHDAGKNSLYTTLRMWVKCDLKQSVKSQSRRSAAAREDLPPVLPNTVECRAFPPKETKKAELDVESDADPHQLLKECVQRGKTVKKWCVDGENDCDHVIQVEKTIGFTTDEVHAANAS